MSKLPAVSDLPKQLDSYQPLDLFLAPEEGDDMTNAGDDRSAEDLADTFAARMEATDPSSIAVYHALLGQIPHSVVTRLRACRPVLILLRMPSIGWCEVVEQGCLRVLERLVMTSWLLRSDAVAVYSSRSVKSTWDKKLPSEKAATILRTLADNPAVLAMAPDESIDPSLRAFCDVEITVEITPATFEAMLSDHFDGEKVDWPADLRIAAVDPTWIDAAVGRAETAAEAVTILRGAVAGVSKTSTIRLEDLHGYGSAKDWGLRLAAAICDYRSGRLPWRDVDAGALLIGPPGTGKTLFAQALANSTGLVFFPTSFSAWQGTGEGHLGDVTRQMRKVFADASGAAPSIVFIDEIDSLPARGTTGKYDDWWRAIVNSLLECLDGAGRRDGVVVLAACNDGRNLDPAILRSGRLDRQFAVELPGEDDLVQILRHHLPTLSDTDIQPVAEVLSGSTSGADAARLAREARQIARTQKREVATADLVSVSIPTDTRSDALRRRIAVHEAGHAVTLLRLGITPDSLSIVGADGGHVSYKLQDDGVLAEDVDRRLQIHLSGRAAEEVLLGAVSGGAGGMDTSDLGQATALVKNAEARLGLGLGGRISMSQTIDDDLVEGRLRNAYAKALVAAIGDRRLIERLAELALRQGVVGRRALEDFWHAQVKQQGVSREANLINHP